MRKNKIRRIGLRAVALFVMLSSVLTVTAGSVSAKPVTGSYKIEFPSGNQLSAGSTIVVRAVVRDPVNLAPSGTIVWQICKDSSGSGVASATCDAGTARWDSWFRDPVDPACGCAQFGVQNPNVQTIGYRYKYVGQGSGIANGISSPADAVWT